MYKTTAVYLTPILTYFKNQLKYDGRLRMSF